jgi:hypothetical protein
MKASHLVLALFGLLFLVDILVGEDSGVLRKVQENAQQQAVTGTQASAVAEPPAKKSASTGSNQWAYGDDSLAPEEPAAITPDTPEDLAAATPATPVAAQPQVGSPEFPRIPLPRPQLTVAGAQVYYPSVAER